MQSRGVARRAVRIAAASLGQSQMLGLLNGKLLPFSSKAWIMEFLPGHIGYCGGAVHSPKCGTDAPFRMPPAGAEVGIQRRLGHNKFYSTEASSVRGRELVGLYGYGLLKSPRGFNKFAQEAIERYELSHSKFPAD